MTCSRVFSLRLIALFPTLLKFAIFPFSSNSYKFHSIDSDLNSGVHGNSLTSFILSFDPLTRSFPRFLLPLDDINSRGILCVHYCHFVYPRVKCMTFLYFFMGPSYLCDQFFTFFYLPPSNILQFPTFHDHLALYLIPPKISLFSHPQLHWVND